jgi:hypothetical protein
MAPVLVLTLNILGLHLAVLASYWLLAPLGLVREPEVRPAGQDFAAVTP